MQRDLKKIEDAGVRVAGVSYDSVEVLKGFADKQKITFPLLSDPDSKTIAAYALRNKETAGKKFGKVDLDGVPYPGTLLIDKEGVVRAKLFVDGYKDRHSVEELVKAAEGLKKKSRAEKSRADQQESARPAGVTPRWPSRSSTRCHRTASTRPTRWSVGPPRSART